MAMSAGSSGKFSNEINVTPMIDILLVLLIIFMMQVSLQRKVMNVNVPPETPPSDKKSAPSNQIVLVLGADGSYSVNADTVPKGQLDQKLHSIYDTRPAKLMFIKAAGNRKYQEVVEAMDIARSAGVQVIGITPPEEKQ